jgi:hypothetical protein
MAIISCDGDSGEEEGWGNRNLAPTIYVAFKLGCCTTFVSYSDMMDFERQRLRSVMQSSCLRRAVCTLRYRICAVRYFEGVIQCELCEGYVKEHLSTPGDHIDLSMIIFTYPDLGGRTSHFAGVVNGIACYTAKRLGFARECSNRSGDAFCG